jgi:hypothetical protein
MEWSDRIGRRLKFSDLHILLAVVQHGDIFGSLLSLNYIDESGNRFSTLWSLTDTAPRDVMAVAKSVECSF